MKIRSQSFYRKRIKKLAIRNNSGQEDDDLSRKRLREIAAIVRQRNWHWLDVVDSAQENRILTEATAAILAGYRLTGNEPDRLRNVKASDLTAKPELICNRDGGRIIGWTVVFGSETKDFTDYVLACRWIKDKATTQKIEQARALTSIKKRLSGKPKEWLPISNEDYHGALGAVPPAYSTGKGFLSGEPYSSDSRGNPTYRAYIKIRAAPGKALADTDWDYFESSSPMTIEAFKEALATNEFDR